MSVKKPLLLFALAFSSSSSAVARQVDLEEAFSALRFKEPVALEHAGDGSGRLYVVERRGTISAFENRDDVSSADPFLDIQDRVSTGGELGLLGLAFHPNYAENGSFYVYYTTATDAGQRSRVSRFARSSEDPTRAAPESETILLEVPQPADTHNAGDLAFGPDGMLYGAIGDGGQDPEDAQDLTNLLGTLFRIDVDATSGGRPYGIPADNPFAGNDEGYREEIYAYGLRNPWRFSIDGETGTLWAADVGDDAYEEVNQIAKGGNYGWPIMEGPDCNEADGCDQSGLTLPVHTYRTGSVGRSITGGHVYRGSSAPGLRGAYVYGDFVLGSVWKLEEDGEGAYADQKLSLSAFPSVVAFGEDAHRELYVLDYSSGGIYRFTESTSISAEPDAPLPDETRLEMVGQNPFQQQTELAFTVPRRTRVDVAIYDVLGRRVATLFTGEARAGETQRVTFEAGSLPAGTYFCWMRADGATRTRVLALTR